ncbi:MAG: methyltransferase domain-containing protein [Planctomycetota bacterium]
MHFDRLARNWENLAKQDPMWAILTDERKKGRAWDPEAFFQTGRETIAWLGSWLGLHHIEVPRGKALDFGCGLGRLTQALAPHFEHVTGVDISESMVRGATQHNRFGEKVRYLHNPHPDLRAIDSDSLAFVLSAIVLQHMRTEYQRAYVREFVRVLQPGGLLFFQAPVAVIREGAFQNAGDDESAEEARMEMHCLSRNDIDTAVQAHGGRVVLVEPDTWAGEHWTSAHYLVKKDGGVAPKPT